MYIAHNVIKPLKKNQKINKFINHKALLHIFKQEQKVVLWLLLKVCVLHKNNFYNNKNSKMLCYYTQIYL